MTAAFDEAELRNWLVDYLVTNIGCSPDEIDLDVSLNDLGVGSRDAVVLSGELSELLGRPVSPVDFWQHPTINEPGAVLTRVRARVRSRAGARPGSRRSTSRSPSSGWAAASPARFAGPEALWQFLCDRRSAIGEVPPERWAPFDDGSPEVAAALARTTRWGVIPDRHRRGSTRNSSGSRPAKPTKMDPQQRLLLEVAWEALEHAGIPAELAAPVADRGIRRGVRQRVRRTWRPPICRRSTRGATPAAR